MSELKKLLDTGRVALVQTNKDGVEQIAKKLDGALGISAPSSEDEFPSFLLGMIRTLIRGAGFSNRFAETVVLDADTVQGPRLMAMLEAVKKLTSGRLVLCCRDGETLRAAATGLMDLGMMPGIAAVQKEDRKMRECITDLARANGTCFWSREVLSEVVEIAQELQNSPCFRVETLLHILSCGEEKKQTITAAAIERESAEGGYISLCRGTNTNARTTDRVIGFGR